MPARTQDTRLKQGSRYLYALGLLAMALGFVLLLLPILDRILRPAGAAALLLGVVMVGSYFMGRLKAEMLADGPATEPGWRKPAHGSAGFGTLPVTDGPAATLPNPGTADAAPSVAISPSINAPASTPAEPVWGPELFEKISPQQFEAVCEALFAQGGFETRCQSHGAAGGVTIWLYSRHARQGIVNPAAVALCKQWPAQPVGVQEMHPLLELMKARQLKRGTYATSSSYTDNARKFAKYNSINALDGAALLGLIAGRTHEQQQALLLLARGSS